MTRKYELTFWGGIAKRYRRFHATFESAQATALAVLARLPARSAHPAIIYGPDCGRDGITVN